MLRSLSSAISAMQIHQTYLDVISMNISNVNTVGYKSSRVSFEEMLSQTLNYGSAPAEGISGTNPVQIGLGARLAGVDTVFTQGNPRATGKATDMAIQGRGFFILGHGNDQFYSRDGTADVSVDGFLVNPISGLRILGWTADGTGAINTDGPIGPISIPYGINEARATATVNFQGNLDTNTAVGDSITSSVAMYDSLGNLHMLEMTLTRTGVSEWTWGLSTTDPAVTDVTLAGTDLTFDSSGFLVPGTPPPSVQITYDNGADAGQIDLNLSAVTQLNQLGKVNAVSQDGLAPGSLIDFGIGERGEVIGLYSNGLSRVIGQIALAEFGNPAGLIRAGGNLFLPSANSGLAQIGVAGDGARGSISAGFLEMSNVDLAREFTDMIVAQRGFQANSRVISTSDEVLQELVNLKR
ncbi:MAG: flagellar hook protein FlgE [Anaerolineae bacterium]|jgi:flagellar hook protein FlgE